MSPNNIVSCEQFETKFVGQIYTILKGCKDGGKQNTSSPEVSYSVLWLDLRKDACVEKGERRKSQFLLFS